MATLNELVEMYLNVLPDSRGEVLRVAVTLINNARQEYPNGLYLTLVDWGVLSTAMRAYPALSRYVHMSNASKRIHATGR